VKGFSLIEHLKKPSLKKIVNEVIGNFGYEVVKSLDKPFPPDFTDEVIQIIKKVSPYTMTSVFRLNALIQAVDYVVKNQIPGAFVECGVWKGGSTMAALHRLVELEELNRSIYLFDTFQGMSEPTENDVTFAGGAAKTKFEKLKWNDGAGSDWDYSSIEEVKQNIETTGYPKDAFHFIKGKVEETIPEGAPEEIALLRLDTDWYESTKHELEHLYPRLKSGGVLIIDDYGHWQGCRRAVDEYFAKLGSPILLNRIDYTGRIAVKL